MELETPLWFTKFCQNLWVSAMMVVAKSAFLASPLKANWFSGLPSGIL